MKVDFQNLQNIRSRCGVFRSFSWSSYPGAVLQDLWCSLRHSRVYGSAHTPSSRGSSHRKLCGCIFETIIDRGGWHIGSHLFHHLYLAVEGQVIHVLVYHQLRQKGCSGIAACDRLVSSRKG